MPTSKTTATNWAKLKESPRDWRCVRWLRKKPIPTLIKGEDDEGEEITVRLVSKSGERPKWADAARALHRCSRLTAYDDDGAILRTLEHDDDHDPELRAEVQRETARETGAVPYGSPLLAIDVPRLVKEIAESMQRVSVGAAEQQARAHAEAFKQMGNVLNVAMNLLVRLERQLEAVEERHAAATDDDEEEPTDEKTALAMAAIQKVLGGGSSLALPNGAGGVDLGALMKNVTPEQVNEFLSLMQGNGGAQNGS